jgi:hypothetical protein
MPVKDSPENRGRAVEALMRTYFDGCNEADRRGADVRTGEFSLPRAGLRTGSSARRARLRPK